uniref:Integrase catalytic domain-containing protein n=1 Tax=Aegilops tauschii subsp. strangulata TaxID=200361 RepID=A0A453MBJ6_AEGTS
LRTQTVLMTSSSSGDLYPFFGNKSTGGRAFSITTSDLWHRRLGHPGKSSLASTISNFLPDCNNSAPSFCEACHLGRQPRLAFASSNNVTTAPFQLVHCDLWTSPVTSFSGFAYYLVVLDHYTHYSWTFPLRAKSDTSPTLLRFFQYILTQFHVLIKCMQYDNGGSSSIQPFVPFSLIMG